MKTEHVVVLPYDANWKLEFENIKREIEAAVGDLVIGIEHVGSTSVEGLCAKPCIDIDVVIADYSVFDSVAGRLAAIGYTHEGNLGIRDREASGIRASGICRSIICMCARRIPGNCTGILLSGIS